MAQCFDNLNLEKGMYKTGGKGLTQTLELLDPSENYAGTPLESLDAFQRQLKRFDIKVYGANSDVIEKFFATSQSAVLFPEYVARAVKQGINEADILNKIVATTTNIDALDYRTITSEATDDQKSLRKVAEGAAIPKTTIKTSESLVKLNKRGRMLTASYEAMRFQRLDLFAITLKQIGSYISKMHLNDAIDVIENGDGNSNPATVCSVNSSPIGKAGDSFSYESLVNLWAQFEDYNMNTLLCGADSAAKIVKMEEFLLALNKDSFANTGKAGTPLGANLLKTNSLSGRLIALDKNFALEMVKAGDVLIEYDKLIDRQLERAAITSIAGFAKIYADAAKILTI